VSTFPPGAAAVAQDPNAFFSINRSDPAFVAANAQCKQLLPNRGPRATTTTATS